MSSTQLSFALRTTSNVKTVHLIGSWDGYQGQLPLSRDGSRSGSWKGTFKFQANVLQAGQRYWFYYMMDGHKVSHDPTKEAVVEPTTGRTLNVLDVPKSKSSSSSGRHHSSSSKHSSRRRSRELPRGRGVPDGAIACPKPQRPGATQRIIDQGYSQADVDQLAWHLANASLQEQADDYDDDNDEEDDEAEYDGGCYDDGQGPYVYDEGDGRAYLAAGSDDDSDAPSLTSGSSRSSGSSSPSSVSSGCSCERYAVTRSGNRVRLDCGGSVCGSSSDSDDGGAQLCSAPVEDYSARRGGGHLRDSRRISRHHGSSRRHGMVMG